MSVRGAVYFKAAFPFKDGGKSDKLMLLLNTTTEDDDYLFVLTTSQHPLCL